MYQQITVRGKRKRIYLGKEQMALAKKLAKKAYLEKRNQDIQEILSGIEAYKSVFNQNHEQGRYLMKSRTERLLEERPGMRNLLLKEDQYEWMNAPYERLSAFEEGRIHFVSKDVAVRSKSEELIMITLDRYLIPYRYDCGVVLPNGTKVYPDFVIKHPRTKKLILWEHFGMMSDPEYRKKAARKIDQYLSAGLTPMVDFIITCETDKVPMSAYSAECVVKWLLR